MPKIAPQKFYQTPAQIPMQTPAQMPAQTPAQTPAQMPGPKAFSLVYNSAVTAGRCMVFCLFSLFFISALVLNLLANPGPAHANSRPDLSSDPLDAGQTFRMDAISRPAGLRFPVVFYLAIDHPSIMNIIEQTEDRKLVPGANVNLPLYIGYLVVDENNGFVFVSRVDNLPLVKKYVSSIVLEQQQKQQNGLTCSVEGPYFCAPENSWSAVWVLLNDFYRKGVYVAGYTTGQDANVSFVPSFKAERSEAQHMASVLYPKEWPEISNNLLGMKAFSRQAYGLPLYAQWWYGMNSAVSLNQGFVPQNMAFPLVYYVNLTNQGVQKFQKRMGQEKAEGEFNNTSAPQYAGYLVVDQDYTYLFTRKCSFSISLPMLVNVENALKPGEQTEVDGFFNMRISAPAHSWNGLGVFLAKIVSSGDYEIFAYTSGKPAIYNLSLPPAPPASGGSLHFKNNINDFSYLYETKQMLSDYEKEGLIKFNSILFYEFGWPAQWAKGSSAPRLENAWK